MYQTKIGHAHLKVRNLDRAVEFYTRFLNLQVAERVGDQYVFLSGGDLHHEVALQNVGPNAPQPHSCGVALSTLGFLTPSRKERQEKPFGLCALASWREALPVPVGRARLLNLGGAIGA
jgi:catechol-2,3-dioxygenase